MHCNTEEKTHTPPWKNKHHSHLCKPQGDADSWLKRLEDEDMLHLAYSFPADSKPVCLFQRVAEKLYKTSGYFKRGHRLPR